MNGRDLVVLTRRSFSSALDDNCFNIAKGAAFSATLSLFPGLIVVAALLFRGDAAEMVGEISRFMGQVLPPDVHHLLTDYLSISAGRSTALLVGAGLVAIICAAELMISLMEGFRAAYHLPKVWSGWKEHAVALGLVFLAVVPVAAASALMVFGRLIEERLVETAGNPWWAVSIAGLGRWVLAMLTITLVLSMLYHVAPNRRQRWRDVWPGAVFATLLWLPSTLLFALYVQYLAVYRDLYGSVATVVALLIWMYLVSSIVMLGCEFNVQRERMRESPATRQSEAETAIENPSAPAIT